MVGIVGSGGARIGAGKKKMPLQDKILTGNRSKAPITVLKFPNEENLVKETMPEPREYLIEEQKNSEKTLAEDVYSKTWEWLDKRRCAHLIPVQLIENYAQNIARHIQAEQKISQCGLTVIDEKTGRQVPSPFIAISQSYMRQANTMWLQIYQTVKENNAGEYKANPHDDLMESLLSASGK